MELSGKDNYGFAAEEQHGAATREEPKEEKAKKKKTKAKWTCCQIFLMVLFLLMVAASVAFLIAFPAIFDAILNSKMEVVPGSYAYKLWHYTPVPIFLRFYIYNLTNPDDFANGEKAVLQEIGPYVYQEFHEKKNISFHDNNTVTFYQQRWWMWDQEASGNLTQNDTIIVLNTVPVAAAWTVYRNKPSLLGSLNVFFRLMHEKLFVTTTVGQILFDGFSDPILDATHMGGGISMPSFLPPGLAVYDKFGWFYKRNLSLTYDGLFNMHTGHDTLDNLGKIDWWNYGNETDFFESPCNLVAGSAGELWPPGQQKTNVTLFSPDLCMTMTLYYKEEVTEDNGLPGYRYWGTNETLPGDGCYCIDEVCAPTGLLNAETCRMGAPAFISFPHYLHADPSLMNSTEGISSPDPDKHSFTLDMIPEVGIPIKVTARMQINMLVKRYKNIKLLRSVREGILPLLWFEEEAVIPEHMARQLQVLLVIMNTPTVTIILSVTLVLGVIGASLVTFCHFKKAKRGRGRASKS